MRHLKLLAALALIGTIPVSAYARQVDVPGGCGEYRYWKHGHCEDARNAPGDTWPEQMAKKKATW